MAIKRNAKADKAGKVVPVEDYEHSAAKRTNNPMDRGGQHLGWPGHLGPHHLLRRIRATGSAC